MKTQQNKINILILLGISFVWFLIGWVANEIIKPQRFPLLEKTLKIFNTEALYPIVSMRDIQYDAIRGMLMRLDDPYATLLAPPVSDRFEPDFAGESGVIGAAVEKIDGVFSFTYIFEGQPADEAGLKVGDILLSVDDFEIGPLTTNSEISYMIRGPVDQPVKLSILRDGKIWTFDIFRQPRTIVTHKMLTPDIGLITQYTFTTNADEMFFTALNDLIDHGAKGIIWDLRSNGGGSVQTAQHILSAFFTNEALFVVAFPDGSNQSFYPVEGIDLVQIPLVVLVGEHTYSSAELCAAAIQDWSRGILIGETTHGKATITTTEPIAEDVLLQFSVAKCLTPKGAWIQDIGIDPDYLVIDQPETDLDEVIEKGLEILSEQIQTNP